VVIVQHVEVALGDQHAQRALQLHQRQRTAHADLSTTSLRFQNHMLGILDMLMIAYPIVETSAFMYMRE
jgi:hypothetical protein